ncbi:MAG: VOC family protein [Proteobacteria bacterium]|nr:VOC family protein [Pseudomonadota bacterium]
MSLIKHLHHASLVASDLAASRAFYEGVLELPVNPARPKLPYDGIWYDIGDSMIHLLVVPNPDKDAIRPEHGGVDRHTALLVHDFDELITRLEKAGIPYSVSKSGRKALFCRDPDGNALEFMG